MVESDGGTVRIAMWSGPRNISTALMRAWKNRLDTAVIDEPFYACYLAATGIDHPGRDAVLASQPTDWRRVVESLLGPVPQGASIFYQKHMTHHLTADIGWDWLNLVTNCFLIRDPNEVLRSYVKTRDAVTPDDLGYDRQVAIFDRARERTGRVPPVIDARDVLENPRALLERLCAAIGVAFDGRMLVWPPGRRRSDGVWAPYWYANVERSTGFAPYRPPREPLAKRLIPVAEACMPAYRTLHRHRLKP